MKSIATILFILISLQLTTVAADRTHPLQPQASALAGLDCPLYADEVSRAKSQLAAAIKAGLRVPQPEDPGGGASHEQHKRNYAAIYQGGLLHQITGDPRYLHYVRDLLLAYADMYPGLGPHPARRKQEAGRLFWQNLNDSVWLVHTIQGYAAIRSELSSADRERIETQVLRPAAEFLSAGSPRTFSRIHNHATWATAAVGMTGYVLEDRELVEIALLGLAKDGQAGFLRQTDLLFSPDGYYSEGPYYQRYALLPFMVFASAIDQHEPQRKIFEHRDGILLKALRATVDLTYRGYFFPINDAIKDKSLRTAELYQGIAIAYAQRPDPQLLSIAQRQGRTVLGPNGERVGCDLAAGRAQPYGFQSRLFGDGTDGKQGALALFRAGPNWGDATLIAKNTAQGMGHGHFDKLSWIYYDNGAEIVRDYGAARFLNVEAKQGGTYLPENTTWAKQTVAHNTLVVDQRSHFDGDPKRAQKSWPVQLYYSDSPQLQISSARIDDAYPDTQMLRTLALLPVAGLSEPLVVDLLRVHSEGQHQYDLPLHYRGQIMRVGAELDSNPQSRPVLGADHGYQHLWVDATARPSAEQAFLTWIHGSRFYTWRWIPQPGAELILAESGANDPHFNLRRQPALIQRVSAASDTVFAGVLEAHGRYDGASERTVASDSQISKIELNSSVGKDLFVVETLAAGGVVLALSYDPNPQSEHALSYRGRTFNWRGYAARFELPAEGE